MWSVHQRLCKIEHERLSFLNLAVNVIECIVLHRIRTIWTVVISLAVVVVVAVCETVCLMDVTAFLVEFHLSQEGLVETELRNHLTGASHLPFSYDCSRIPGFLRNMGECPFVIIHISEADVVLIVVHSGHHLHSARTAQRQRVHVGIQDTACCKRIYMRRLVLRTSVTSEAFSSDVVCKKEHDVRLLLWCACCDSHHRAEQAYFLHFIHKLSLTCQR